MFIYIYDDQNLEKYNVHVINTTTTSASIPFTFLIKHHSIHASLCVRECIYVRNTHYTLNKILHSGSIHFNKSSV